VSTSLQEDSTTTATHSGRRLVAVGAVALVLLAGVAVTTRLALDNSSDDAAGDFGLDVALVGDSFAQQASAQFLALAEAEGLDAEASAMGGTSICHFEDVLADLHERRPHILVLSFAGNDTPNSCFNPTDEAREAETVAADYRPELDAVIDQFADTGAEIYVVLPPPIRDPQFEARASAMRSVYREAKESHPDLHLIDSASRLDPDGEGYVEALPCEEWDTDCSAGGAIVLRQDDGIHLTPAGGERYARSILDEVGPALGG
jgi:hypothetical protein